MEDHIIMERAGGLWTLRLNRPERLNAMSKRFLELFDSEINSFLTDRKARVLLITGTGRAFCAGVDVGELEPPDPARTLANMRKCHSRIKAMRASGKLIVTGVNGLAVGGGFGLAMLGDVILASENAYFKGGFLSIGIAADYGLGFTLPRAVGSARAAEILLSDRRVQAAEALDMGMVGRVIPVNGFTEDVRAFSARLAELPFGAQLMKRQLRFGEKEELERFLDFEAQCQIECFQSRDYLEGINAFMDKRSPRFTNA